jgi:undecaprenyl-diphosphatase
MRDKPQSVRPLMLLVTALGEPVVIILVCLAVGGYEALYGNAKVGNVLLLACAASFLVLGLSFALRRSRPATPFARAMPIKTYSFPSEHAFTSLVASGLVAYFCFVALPFLAWLPVALALLAFAVAVGYSRIYLGAHFILDVVAGWLLGAGALALLLRLLL